MIKNNIGQLLVENGCYINSRNINQDGITTTSGDTFQAYLCCRLAISNIKLRDEIVNELATMIHETFGNNVTLAGMATAGIPWASMIAYLLKSPMLYIRNKPKSYGLNNMIEGDLNCINNNIILVDDVLYTGGSIKNGIEALGNEGIKTQGIACIAKLSENTINELNDMDIKTLYLTDYDEILENALSSGIINEEEKSLVRKLYIGK